MKDRRPVNLDLLAFRFPITAIVSIGHRIAGVVLFLFLPYLLWLLQLVLGDGTEFRQHATCFASVGGRLLIWVLLSALSYHVLAGVRHLAMSFGWGETKEAGCRSAIWVLLLTGLSMLACGVLLCLP